MLLSIKLIEATMLNKLIRAEKIACVADMSNVPIILPSLITHLRKYVFETLYCHLRFPYLGFHSAKDAGVDALVLRGRLLSRSPLRSLRRRGRVLVRHLLDAARPVENSSVRNWKSRNFGCALTCGTC